MTKPILSQRANGSGVQNKQQVVLHHQHQTVFDPAVVRAYSEMVPDAAERILRILESNNEAERQLRKQAQDLQQAESDRLKQDIHLLAADHRRKDWIAACLIGGCLVASVIFSIADKPWLAGTSLASVIGAVAYGFVKSKK
jgi:hypothetical protein